jgi:cytochrome c biogenesis protein CcmG, thiol:disulfide interchange protein DsbE
MRRWLPLGVFCVLLVFLYLGLFHDPREVPSPFVGQPAPSFTLPIVEYPGQTFAPERAQGRPWLLNVWAPWCTTCVKEHQFLMQVAASGVAIYGLNWKDAGAEARTLLARMGSPYVLNADDRDGRVGIDWGVTGVPETFVIDAEGIIRMKHSGPINDRIWQRKFAPLLLELGS